MEHVEYHWFVDHYYDQNGRYLTTIVDFIIVVYVI